MQPACPTPYVAQLLPTLRQELTRLRALVVDSTDPVNHASVLELADAIINAVEPVIGLFFAHPTQRLSGALLLQADNLIQAAGWLVCHVPSNLTGSQCDEYAACCDRLESLSRDWRLSIRLESVARNLEDGPPETLH
jgi:hypothetical protein